MIYNLRTPYGVLSGERVKVCLSLIVVFYTLVSYVCLPKVSGVPLGMVTRMTANERFGRQTVHTAD